MFKVMLVEDDPTMVSLLTTLLELEGFIVRTPLSNRVDGILKAMQKEHPQMAYVDVNLQHGTGLELVRLIRATPEVQDTSILMSSGLSLESECLQAGADGFIQKPFMPDELIDLIHKINHNKNNQDINEKE
jgi:DNA-binding response OmpR family regulator